MGYLHLSQQKPDGYSIVWSSNSISTNFHIGPAAVRLQEPRARRPRHHREPGAGGEGQTRRGRRSRSWWTTPRPIPKRSASAIPAQAATPISRLSPCSMRRAPRSSSVPFSAGQATVNLLGDRIEAAVQFPQAFVSHVKSGDLRVLAMLGTIPDPCLPRREDSQAAGLQDRRWTCGAASRSQGHAQGGDHQAAGRDQEDGGVARVQGGRQEDRLHAGLSAVRRLHQDDRRGRRAAWRWS